MSVPTPSSSVNKNWFTPFVMLCVMFGNERSSDCGQTIIVDLICRRLKRYSPLARRRQRFCR
ncbi:hypothetical protein T4B_2943 [Trichinella pseudospiralis]|uniref:Uncharacterized protein n=1 Tax=Trichinella pseudospiralis TaxID=6337 RepID=A0A0V1JW12_TRIPS|nr:hypothetical protein T4B_2943 [Trichinella pseudospiralis]KRZ39187.1 hypothetical protein T4C_12376 [Trichinella pseudospiralis]